MWDLFNEPDNPNGFTYGSTELADKRDAVTPLVDAVFDWATEADPPQPLTVGIWMGVHGRPERVSRLNEISIGRSDVLSFHSYRRREPLRRAVAHLSQYEPPAAVHRVARPLLGLDRRPPRGLRRARGRRLLLGSGLGSLPDDPPVDVMGDDPAGTSPIPGSTISSEPTAPRTTPTRPRSSARHRRGAGGLLENYSPPPIVSGVMSLRCVAIGHSRRCLDRRRHDTNRLDRADTALYEAKAAGRNRTILQA